MTESLNLLIIDHLRHYGYMNAARVLENETKDRPPKIMDSQTKLENYLNIAINTIEGAKKSLSPQKNLLEATKLSSLMSGNGYRVINLNDMKLNGKQPQSDNNIPKLHESQFQSPFEMHEKDSDKQNRLKLEFEKDIEKILKKELYSVVFSYEELQLIKTKFLECLDKTMFLTRDCFLIFMSKLHQIANQKLLDKIFVFIIKQRPHMLGSKIPLNCLTFQEVLYLLELIHPSTPIKMLSFFAKLATEDNLIIYDRYVEILNLPKVGSYFVWFQLFNDGLAHFTKKNPKTKSFALQLFLEETRDFEPFQQYFQDI